MAGQEERQRLEFDFSRQAVESLDALKDKRGAESRAEVIRHALALLDWLHEETSKGYAIHLVKGEEVREIDLIYPSSRHDS